MQERIAPNCDMASDLRQQTGQSIACGMLVFLYLLGLDGLAELCPARGPEDAVFKQL